ncbi:MAG: YkvA family protein [Rhizobiaceae bacterium]
MDKPIDGEILGPGEEFHRAEVRRGFWATAKKAARAIPFMDEVVAAYFCAMDPQTPLRARMILLGALGYFILPIDSIPDFLLVFGFSDDIAVLTAAIATVRAHITPAHRKAAQDALKDEQQSA